MSKEESDGTVEKSEGNCDLVERWGNMKKRLKILGSHSTEKADGGWRRANNDGKGCRREREGKGGSESAGVGLKSRERASY